LALGGPFLSSFAQKKTVLLRKWSSGHVGPPVLAVKLFLSL